MKPTGILLMLLLVGCTACGNARPYRPEDGYESLRPHLLR